MSLPLLRTNPRPRRNPDYASMGQEQLVKEYLDGYDRYLALAERANSALRDLDESGNYDDKFLRAKFMMAQEKAKKAMDDYSAIMPFLTTETKMKYLTKKVSLRVPRGERSFG
jgi:hypothetical protein